MASMKYYDKHNQVGFLKKPEESTGSAEIVDFLKGSHIRYALTHNLTIHDSLVKQFWQTTTALILADGTLDLRATIDTLEYTITKASIRSKLQLADASGISMLPNTEIFEGMGNMGYPADEKVEKFIPMNSELEASKFIPILRYNIRKSLARKGLQKNKSESIRSDTEEDVEAYMDERVDEPSSEEFQMGSIPQGSAPAKVVKWQILKTGLLNDLTRDDLKELYRLMMLKYGDSRPEEEYESFMGGFKDYV
ncbi:hypothetical protein Tco_0491620 [Tanacetum coccineum]